MTATAKTEISHDVIFDLKAAAARICASARRALSSRDAAVSDAILCGHEMIETKGRLAHGQWLPWIEKHCPEISHMTATRWMRAAQEQLRALGGEAPPIPPSQLLTLPDAELTDEARECRQLLLDFSEGKTIKECMAGVIVEGDAAHRVTRAVNGKMLGGHRGEDRKDFPAFVAKKLKEITSHLTVPKTRKMPRHERELDIDQRVKIAAAFDAALTAWPRWLLDAVKAAAARELKISDVERRGR